MSTETVGAAVAKVQSGPVGLIEKYRSDFAMVLPSHIKAETWIRLAVGLVRRDKKLAEACASDPGSMMAALLDAARQGLEPGTDQYYLTQRKVKGKPTVLGIRGYQGEIELIYRAGAVSSVIAEVVRDGDLFLWEPGAWDTQQPSRWQGAMDRPIHKADWFTDRGALIGVYAYAVMKDGAVSRVVVLNQQHIDAAKKYSQGSDSDYSPWRTNPEAMWLKTAAHRLQKWVPTSAEYMREQLRAVRDVATEQPPATSVPSLRVEQDFPGVLDHPNGEVYEGELVEDGPTAGDLAAINAEAAAQTAENATR